VRTVCPGEPSQFFFPPSPLYSYVIPPGSCACPFRAPPPFADLFPPSVRIPCYTSESPFWAPTFWWVSFVVAVFECLVKTVPFPKGELFFSEKGPLTLRFCPYVFTIVEESRFARTHSDSLVFGLY